MREQYNKQDPYKSTTPFLDMFTNSKASLYALKDRYNKQKKKDSKDYLDMFREFNSINQNLDKSKDALFNANSQSDKIFEV